MSALLTSHNHLSLSDASQPLKLKDGVQITHYVLERWFVALAKSVTGNRRKEINFLKPHMLCLLLLVEATISKGSAACNYLGLSFTSANPNSQHQTHKSVIDYMKCMYKEQHSYKIGEFWCLQDRAYWNENV
jgi:hypothetical protein